MKSVRLLFTLLALACCTTLALAQPIAERYLFPDGVGFDIPPGGQLVDEGNGLPVIVVGQNLIIEMVPPTAFGQDPNVTLGLPLPQVLSFLLGLVQYDGPDTAIALTLADGRSARVQAFVNATEQRQTVMVVRFSDERVGALNVRSFAPLSEAEVQTIVNVATSFDIRPDTPPATASGPRRTPAELALLEGLTESFTYDSGTTFSYPPNFSIIDPSATVVMLINDEDSISIEMVDPNFIRIPAGEPMDAMMSFVTRRLEASAPDFQPLDIGRREAFIGPGEQASELVNTLVLVRFDDETVGILDIRSLDPLTDDEIDQIRAITASFNATTEFTGITREAMEAALALFEDGMAQREAGDIEGSLITFTEALALDDAFALAYYWRANSHQDLGDLEAALVDFQRALEILPEQVQVNLDIAEVYALLDDMPAAVAALDALLAVRDLASLSDTQRFLNTTYRQVAAGEYVEDFHYFRANVLRSMGRYEPALRDNALLLENNDQDVRFHIQQGLLYTDLGQPAEAIVAFTNALRIDRQPIIFYNRGLAHQAGFAGNLDFDSLINMAHDLQCFLLLADDTIDQDLIGEAERILVRTIIQSDDYAPITNPDDCQP